MNHFKLEDRGSCDSMSIIALDSSKVIYTWRIIAVFVIALYILAHKTTQGEIRRTWLRRNCWVVHLEHEVPHPTES
jgi:hypothetical protein